MLYRVGSLRRISHLAGFWGLLAGAAHAQAPAPAAPDSLAGIARQLGRYGQQALVEKLYVHLDRPVYAARETMWLKLYAVDGTFQKPLDLSKVAYVEVLNSLHQPVLQTQIALHNATGPGRARPARHAAHRPLPGARLHQLDEKLLPPSFTFKRRLPSSTPSPRRGRRWWPPHLVTTYSFSPRAASWCRAYPAG